MISDYIQNTWLNIVEINTNWFLISEIRFVKKGKYKGDNSGRLAHYTEFFPSHVSEAQNIQANVLTQEGDLLQDIYETLEQKEATTGLLYM